MKVLLPWVGPQFPPGTVLVSGHGGPGLFFPNAHHYLKLLVAAAGVKLSDALWFPGSAFSYD